jgi:hypothetical protein
LKTTLICLLAALFCQPASYTIQPPNAPHTSISGQGWAYTVPFPVHNVSKIEKLIQCESQGVNIARPDSNHKISWGLLQFNGTATWDEAENRFDFTGSPMIPADAIHMADMMIDAGMGNRWTCWKIQGL